MFMELLITALYFHFLPSQSFCKSTAMTIKKFFKFKNKEYSNGIKSIGDKIGTMCDAHLRVGIVVMHISE